MQWLVVFVAIAAMMGLSFASRSEDRPMIVMWGLTAIYYCGLGPLYWIYRMGGVFVGWQWPIDGLMRSTMILAICSAAVALLIVVAGHIGPLNIGHSFRLNKKEKIRFLSEPLFLGAVVIGLASSMFVLARGSFSSELDLSSRGGLFLIAYQFSDILVASICYDIARRGFNKQNLILITYFVFYAVLVGFRYKIALVAIPLIFCIARSDLPTRLKFWIGGGGAAAVLGIFSLMTLFRDKFGIPDLTRSISNPIESMIYGSLAETNVIFGLTSVIRVHVDQNLLFYFQPLVDAVKELVPRFLFPGRTSGEYMMPSIIGMLTEQGRRSATAYPWIGEFCIMFGKWGLVIGPPAFAGLYVALKSAICATATTRNKALMGIFLLAGLMGYYHFGRGYTPQLFKAYLFILAPYIVMCIGSRFHRGTRLTAGAPSGAKLHAVWTSPRFAGGSPGASNV